MKNKRADRWVPVICTYCGDPGFNFTQNVLVNHRITLRKEGIPSYKIAMKIPMCQICASFFKKYRMSVLDHDCEYQCHKTLHLHGRHWLDEETTRTCRGGFDLNTGTNNEFVYNYSYYRYSGMNDDVISGDYLSTRLTGYICDETNIREYHIDEKKLGIYRQVWIMRDFIFKLCHDETSCFNMLPVDLLIFITDMLFTGL